MMTDWDDIEAFFAEALEQPPARRAAWLDEVCATRPGLRAEIESLLAAHERPGAFLDTPVVEALASPTLTGRRIGAFTLAEPVGRGGMGVVYRADRTDGAFDQRVAVKIVDVGLRGHDVLQRFRAERQILATLGHPNIVGLLDGGVTPDGQAYLVMEYVEGVSITSYCAARRLSLDERIALVERVCDAVQHAHQHGIVHRDLKPANILVTAEGAPKVLDFGIAKLLRGGDAASASDTTDGTLRPLTPNYASPEQLRGLSVTTAGDIYALGVLLYELLTGAPPYDLTGRSLDEMLRIVVDEDPPRPSAAPLPPGGPLPYESRRLRGDLDAIVLAAMRKSAAERYASARELAADLERWRTGRPVLAREPSFRYIALKVAMRHRAAVAATAVSLAALLVTLGVSLWQTRVARAEQVRATARFNDARQLADGLIFRLDAAVGALPGSTPVRRQIVSEALTYLERLSQDPAGDDELRLDLARGYERVAAVQGVPTRPNLGDREGALRSLERAIALLTPLTTGPHPSRDAALEKARSELSLAETLSMLGRHDARRAAVVDAQRISRGLVERDPSDHDARRELASAEFAFALMELPTGRDLPHWEAARTLFQQLLAETPSNPDSQRNVALVEKYIGTHYEENSQFSDALRHHLRARALDEGRLAIRPSDRTAQFDVAIDLSNVAYAQWNTGHARDAADMYERSLVMREALARTDPNDVLARSRVAFVHVKLSAIYGQIGRYPDALRHAHAAVELGASMAGLDAVHRVAFAEDLRALAVAEARARDTAAACVAFRRTYDAVVDLKAGAQIPASERDGIASLLADSTRGLRECPASPATAK